MRDGDAKVNSGRDGKDSQRLRLGDVFFRPRPRRNRAPARRAAAPRCTHPVQNKPVVTANAMYLAAYVMYLANN